MDKRSTALYTFPLIVCALLYWGIWDSWFFQDDFSWLYLNHELTNSNLWTVLTRPMAQGTWRPLSERAQFMLLPALFGLLDATPHHMLAFLTQFLNLLLLNSIVRKLTGSQWQASLRHFYGLSMQPWHCLWGGEWAPPAHSF